MSNSNFNITKIVVDKITQEITGIEVNGKVIDLGINPEDIVVDGTTAEPSSTLLYTFTWDQSEDDDPSPRNQKYYFDLLVDGESIGYIKVDLTYSKS